MRCLHPIVRKYVNHFDGLVRVQECPCGHCLACLHNAQDSWAIRLRETCRAHNSFVYDTLTFNAASITYFDVTEQVLDERRIISPESRKLLWRYCNIDKDTGEVTFYSPAIDRSVIRDWIRNARESFVYDHGYRPKWRYFIVQEYGPKTSRPHFHLLFFGISKSDYIHYFKKPWRRDYGFTKTQFIEGGTDKDRDCITRYVSKYVSKGVFESPLVLDGFSPKPFRSISHGIGIEYLDRPVFDWFRSDYADFFRSITCDLGFESSHSGRYRHVRNLVNNYDFLENFKLPSDEILSRLVTYFDDRGFAHPCPRYYKARLLGLFKPNLLSYKIQDYLLALADLYDNKAFEAFVYSMGLAPGKRLDTQDAFCGLGSRLYHILYHKYLAARRISAKAACERLYIKLKNHYGRAMNLAYVA